MQRPFEAPPKSGTNPTISADEKAIAELRVAAAERRRVKTHNRIGTMLARKNDRAQLAAGAPRWNATRCRWVRPIFPPPTGARRREIKTRAPQVKE